MRKRKLLPPVDWLQGRANEIWSERNENSVEEALYELVEYYDPLNYTINYGFPLWRGRECEHANGFKSISEVHYPPAAKAKVGRINDPGLPLLYTSFTQLTALSEIRAETGDIVQVVGYDMHSDYPIRSLTLGEFANVHLRGQGNLPSFVGDKINNILLKMDFEPGLSFIFLDSFLAALMSNQEAESMNYVHCRTLARILFGKYPNVSAIHYPSVIRSGAMNLAIKPNVADSALSVAGTTVLKINEKFDYGLYRFSILRNSTRFSENGSILWS